MMGWTLQNPSISNGSCGARPPSTALRLGAPLQLGPLGPPLSKSSISAGALHSLDREARDLHSALHGSRVRQ